MIKAVLFSLLFSMGLLGLNAQTSSKTTQKVNLKVGDKLGNDKRLRAPIHLPIEAWYDPVELTVEIVAPKELEGEATLESQGMIVGYSKELNAVFTLPFEKGTYTLTIEGESWSAEGSFSL